MKNYLLIIGGWKQLILFVFNIIKVTNIYYCQNKDIYKVLTIEIFAARQSHFLQKLNSVLIWIFGLVNTKKNQQESMIAMQISC